MDGGKNWQKFMNNLPTVRVDDILVHPRDNDLIVGTHGRSVWIADDITPLQQMTAEVRDEDAALFDMRPVVAWVNDRQKGQQVGGQRHFMGENPPRGAAINYYLKSAGEVTLKVADVNGRTIWTNTTPGPSASTGRCGTWPPRRSQARVGARVSAEVEVAAVAAAVWGQALTSLR
jgi:hypothetical protein